MAGGTFTSQNKIRPGAYINFKAVPQVLSSLGSRGVMTMPVALDWGDTITELFSTDLVDGSSQKKIGYISTDEECQIFREALKNCYKAIIYRLDTGGAKAAKAIGNLTCTAKFTGVVGNTISVSVTANGDGKFTVKTFVNGAQKDTQIGAVVADLVDNDWVDFSGAGAITASVATALVGGSNGSVNEATYTDYLNAVKSLNWNTMAIPQDNTAARTAVIAFIPSQRDTYGRKVQAVLFNADADTEGIISTSQGYATADETVSPTTFTAYFAGLTAGSEITKSNTYKVIDNAVSLVYPNGVTPYTDQDIIDKLTAGKLVLSTRSDGAVVVEQDINTLHTYGTEKSYAFSKNRVIRTLDEIGNSVSLLYSKSYLGKVDNNAAGRTLFKADLISYFNTLQSAGAIQNFDSSTDITVYAGEAIDAVVVEVAVQPVDSMEKLYMTVMVG